MESSFPSIRPGRKYTKMTEQNPDDIEDLDISKTINTKTIFPPIKPRNLTLLDEKQSTKEKNNNILTSAKISAMTEAEERALNFTPKTTFAREETFSLSDIRNNLSKPDYNYSRKTMKKKKDINSIRLTPLNSGGKRKRKTRKHKNKRTKKHRKHSTRRNKK
jgi:hypothetical protein